MSYTDINYCLQILNGEPRWFFDKEKVAEKIQSLDAIQQIGTPHTIYYIVRFLKSNNSAIRQKCAETILHLFGKLDSWNSYMDCLKHLSINNTDLDLYKLYFDEKTYLQLLGIASLNSDGYVREKAVKELRALRDLNGFKFILLRLADWVLPVRIAAMEALESYLNIALIEDLLKQLPIIDWLLQVNRVDLTATHHRIIKFIINQEFSADFYNKIKHLNDKTRLRFYIHLLKHTTPGKDHISLMVKDKNFLIRLEVLKIASQFDLEFRKELITAFLQDQSARIRVNALYGTKPYYPYFEDNIHVLLSDRSASVRELCRQLLKSGNLDFAAIYRERIKKGIFLGGSLAGLSETGTSEDLSVFEQYINSGSSEIVICCLTAINRYDPDSARHRALDLFIHPIKRIRNKAIEILSKSCDHTTLQKIRVVYSGSNYEIKETILKLYHAIGGWNVIGDLLIALTDENRKIRDLGWQLLVKWKDSAVKLFATPISAEIERANSIYKNLDEGKTELTNSRAKLLADMEFYLR